MERWLRWLTVFAKFGAPVLLIAYFIVPFYGIVRPWDVANARLSQFVGERPVMVGFEVRHDEDYLAHQVTDIYSRSYILFPSVLRDPKTVTISQTNDDEPTVSFSSYGFLIDVAWFAIAVALTYWFWFRRGRRRDA
jgi:hypothetical protein